MGGSGGWAIELKIILNQPSAAVEVEGEAELGNIMYHFFGTPGNT